MTSRAALKDERLTVNMSVDTNQLTPSEQGGVVKDPE